MSRPVAEIVRLQAIARGFHMTKLKPSDDAYTLLSELRRGCPVARSDVRGGFWILTRYEDVLTVLKDQKHFSASRTLSLSEDEDGPSIPHHIDPPDHGHYRRDLNALFSPPSISGREPEVRDRARQILAAIVAWGSGDLVSEFAEPYPVETFLLMLGAPLDDTQQLLHWKEMMLHGAKPDDPESIEYVNAVIGPTAGRYFRALLDERALDPSPPNDLLTGLLECRYLDRPFTRDEQVRVAKLLMTAGLDTVTAQLSVSLWYLAAYPDQRQRLLEDPSLIPGSVEELLRHFSIVTTGRLCIEETEVAGQRIRPGDLVMLSLPAAGRDDEEFAEADAVHFDRANNRHLAFGGGPHRCLGSHLARMELRVAIEEVLAAMPNYRLASGFEPEWRWGSIISLQRLDVAVSDD